MSEAGIDFIRRLGRDPLMTRQFSNPARLQSLLDEAANALADYCRFLQEDVAPVSEGNFVIGRSAFECLLNEKHFLSASADQVLDVGEKMLSEALQDWQQHSQQMGEKDCLQYLRKIQAEQAESGNVLDAYRQAIRSAQHWVDHNENLPPLPQSTLSVLPTPAFLSAWIPFAAYQSPLPQDAQQRGLYYVTVSEEEGGQVEHNRYSIDLTTVHEAFPGHHYQFVLTNQQYAGNLTRLIHSSSTLYEGWAMYCEQLAVEQGFLDQPEHHFMLLRDRVWRCLRVVIDTRLHTGKMTLDEAADCLVKTVGFQPQQAKAEVIWYARHPSTASGYALGWKMINSLKSVVDVSSRQERKDFHQRLLSQGSIALPLVIQQAFGEAVWQQVHQHVFGETGSP